MVFLPRFYFGLVIAILLALASDWLPGGLDASIALTLLLTGAALVDLVFIPRSPLKVERKVPPFLRQGNPFEVELSLQNLGEHAARFLIVDSPPPEFSTVQPTELRLASRRVTPHYYRLKCNQRGRYRFGPVFYRVAGPLGLLQRQGTVEQSQEAVVLPRGIAHGSRDLQLALAGARSVGYRPSPWRGEGREFESLREHQHDDDFRHIDWKASAKTGKLITRHYQLERDQRLMILLDCGRLMSARIGPFRKLDYAVSAATQLAQVAAAQGDLVGHALFDDELHRFSEPKKGQGPIARLVRDITPLQSSRQESDYASVFHQMLKRCSRQTLIVCFTDLGDPRSARHLLASVLPLRTRHLPVIVTISNSEVQNLLRRKPETEFDVYRHIAAMEMWNDYQRTLRTLQSRGIATVSVPADQLSIALINEYLRIKSSHRIKRVRDRVRNTDSMPTCLAVTPN
jgi:uncharacterized protein (DUF58 family)